MMEIFWKLFGIASIIFAVFGGMALCMDVAGRNRK